MQRVSAPDVIERMVRSRSDDDFDHEAAEQEMSDAEVAR